MKSGRWKSRSGHQVRLLLLGLSAAAALVPSPWTQLGNMHTDMHTCMCVYTDAYMHTCMCVYLHKVLCCAVSSCSGVSDSL